MLSKFEKPADTAIGMIAATTEPITIRMKTKLSAMRMAISGQLASMLSSPRRSVSVMLRKSLSVIRNARELDLFGHLVQAAAEALPDAIFQVVEEIRREDRGALCVVTAVDQVVQDVLHEHRRLLRSELVENEEINLQKRPEDLRLARRLIRIERRLNLLDEILKVAEEEAPGLPAVDRLQQGGDRQV